jgi:hypothetical protein
LKRPKEGPTSPNLPRSVDSLELIFSRVTCITGFSVFIQRRQRCFILAQISTYPNQEEALYHPLKSSKFEDHTNHRLSIIILLFSLANMNPTHSWIVPAGTLAIMLLLIGFAIFEHITIAKLSLPLTSAITIMNIVVVILTALHVASSLWLRRSEASPNWLSQVSVWIFQIQWVAIPVLVTAFSVMILPSEVQKCLLSTQWQRLFSEHDKEAIQAIQDAFDCCGFNNVRDRAFPFPNDQGAGQCVHMYHRTAGCMRAWKSSLQRHAGLEMGIAIALGVIQVVGFFFPTTVKPSKSRRQTMDDTSSPVVTSQAYQDEPSGHSQA